MAFSLATALPEELRLEIWGHLPFQERLQVRAMCTLFKRDLDFSEKLGHYGNFWENSQCLLHMPCENAVAWAEETAPHMGWPQPDGCPQAAYHRCRRR